MSKTLSEQEREAWLAGDTRTAELCDQLIEARTTGRYRTNRALALVDQLRTYPWASLSNEVGSVVWTRLCELKRLLEEMNRGD